MILAAAPSPDERFDLLVIGAGAVGLSLAVSQARAGRRVLVVEGGGKPLNPHYLKANEGLQTGDRTHLGLVRGRYKGLGGTTRLWGGQLLTFSAGDFAPDPQYGKPGWPYGLEELSPWIDAALDILGVPGGYDSVLQEWQAKTRRSLDISDDLHIAPSVWMRQPDFNAHFRDDIGSSAGPSILVNHEALDIATDDRSGRVTGAILRSRSGEQLAVHADATVIACGTFETSRLLLRAQRLHPSTPLASNRNVGKWFVDHLHGVAGQIAPQDREEFGNSFDTFYAQGHKITPKLRLSDRALSAQGLSNCAMTVNTSFGPGEILREAKGLLRRIVGRGGEGSFSASVARIASSSRIILPLAWRFLRTRRSGKFLAGDVSLGIEVEQVPTPDSYIFLEDGVPPEEARVGLHWSLDGREMDALHYCATSTQEFFRRRKLGEVVLDPRIVAKDPAYFDDCTDSSHQIGGARMARSAEDGVTDANGQVFGMPGLYVAGAPTFPSGSFANPTLTAVATTMRLGAHLQAHG